MPCTHLPGLLAFCLAPAEAGATAACRYSFVLIWQRKCLLAPRHLSHVLVLQTPVSVKSITDYHNFVPPDKAICIGNIQSKVGQPALPELCELEARFSQRCNHAALRG